MTGEMVGGKHRDAVLEGGPHHLPADLRSVRVAADDGTVKIPFAGGYEHFERVDGVAGEDGNPLVYRWSARTRIAE
jgi:hypothetical protein